MKRFLDVVGAVVATLALASSASAQGGGASSTGSISGEIKDGQGGVLPGVTVTATSPAQIGSLTAVTNEPLIEGINTTEGTSAAGFYLDYGSFEEVFIGAAGNSAEMPNSGVLTQFVGMSGSNRPSVSLYYDYENDTFQGKNLAADQIRPAPGATIRPDGNRLASYRNLNLGVGGPIVKDRMWGHFW